MHPFKDSCRIAQDKSIIALPHATALCSLKDPSIKPIDQNTARFYMCVSIDLGFNCLANQDEEGDRLAAAFGKHNVMLMGNHGVTVAGASVAEVFEDLYYLERACRTLVLAYQTGQPLSVMPTDKLAEKTAQEWDVYASIAEAHFSQLKLMLDRTDSSYAAISSIASLATTTSFAQAHYCPG